MSSLEVSHRSTVTPDQIDQLGHMNVRYYGVRALAGTVAMADRLGLQPPTVRSSYTRHHHEQMEGNDLEVRSGVLAGGADGRVRLYHEIRNRADDDLAATIVHELDQPRVEVPVIELPAYAAPRTLDLRCDGMASAPTLDRVTELGLAARRPRRVTTDDTRGEDTVPMELGGQLMWGGERLDGEDSWITTLPNGVRFAFVVVEHRMWFSSEPIRLGTPIQSFRAAVEVGEKISRDVAWCFNTDTGEPLLVTEAVDLCFDMTKRRSMVIPPGFGAEDLTDYHPELAPALPGTSDEIADTAA